MQASPSLTQALVAVVAAAWALPATAQTEDAQATSASERLASPGPEHAWLEPLLGEWEVAMLVYPGPDAEPIAQPPLMATQEWTLGGRYLRETLRAGRRHGAAGGHHGLQPP